VDKVSDFNHILVQKAAKAAAESVSDFCPIFTVLLAHFSTHTNAAAAHNIMNNRI